MASRVWYRNHGQQSSSGVWAYVRLDRGLTGRLSMCSSAGESSTEKPIPAPTALLPFDGDKVAWIYDSVTAG